MTSVISKAEAQLYCAERAAESLDGVEATPSLERQIAKVLAQMKRAFEDGEREIMALIAGRR